MDAKEPVRRNCVEGLRVLLENKCLISVLPKAKYRLYFKILKSLRLQPTRLNRIISLSFLLDTTIRLDMLCATFLSPMLTTAAYISDMKLK